MISDKEIEEMADKFIRGDIEREDEARHSYITGFKACQELMQKRIEELEKQSEIMFSIIKRHKSEIHNDDCSSLMDTHCKCDCMNSQVKEIIKRIEEK